MESTNIKEVSLKSKTHLEAYTKNQLHLAKFELSSKLARLSSFIFLGFFLSLLVLISTIMFSVAFAIFLGQLLANNALAFLIVGGLYLVFALSLYVLRNYVFKNPLLRIFLKEIK